MVRISEEMKDVAIYGAGGFGREVACIIRQINQETPTWNLIGFFDDNPDLKGKSNEYGEILGGVDVLNVWPKPINVLMAIGSGHIVKKVLDKIENKFVEFPNLLYRVTYADPDNVIIGKGNIIITSHLSCAAHLGDFNVLNGSVVFGHDVFVGNLNTFMPATRISGEVTIGNLCFFGVGSIVLQQIKVSDKVKLGAGSVLMTKPKSDSLYIGVPAKLFKY